MSQVAVNSECIDSLKKLLDWAEEYVERVGDYTSADGEISDADYLSPLFHNIREIINAKPITLINQASIDKAAIDTAVKTSRESINPHWRYIVIDSDISEGYLTNDIGEAMQICARRSNMHYVLDIFEANDKSWKTKIIFRADGHGSIEEVDKGSDYLHYDFINQRADLTPIDLVR